MRKAFTLTEMIVVVAIIAILSTIVFVNMRSVRLKSNDTRRVHDLEQIQASLEGYKLSNGSYPKSGDRDAIFWYASCNGTGVSTDEIVNLGVLCRGTASGGWIPNLATSIQLPLDPTNSSRATCNDLSKKCYVYMYGSDGNSYKLMAWEMESKSGQNLAKNDHGATSNVPTTNPDYCASSRFDETIGNFYNDCTDAQGANVGTCERNGNAPDTTDIRYELFSPGARCL